VDFFPQGIYFLTYIIKRGTLPHSIYYNIYNMF
jgi:hypothetical protein